GDAHHAAPAEDPDLCPGRDPHATTGSSAARACRSSRFLAIGDGQSERRRNLGTNRSARARGGNRIKRRGTPVVGLAAAKSLRDFSGVALALSGRRDRDNRTWFLTE